MDPYRWEGLHILGKSSNGVLLARTKQEATATLEQQHFIVRRISKVKGIHPCSKQFKKNIQQLFSQQLAIFIESGINLAQACDLLSQEQVSEPTQCLIHLIKRDLEAGKTLSDTLNQYPHLFNRLFCNLVKTGEHSGKLPVMLDKIADHHKKIAKIKKSIQQATAYPLFILFVGTLLFIMLLLFIMPQFEALFSTFNAPLPKLTQRVIRIGTGIKTHWMLFLSIPAFCSYALYYAKKKQIDGFFLKIPILGTLFTQFIITRFLHTFSVTLAAGLPLHEALNLVSEAVANTVYSKAIEQANQDILLGETIQQAIINTQRFPHLISHMIGIGEQTGTLEHMLNQCIEFYEDKIQHTIHMIGRFIEPLIMAILGLFIGTLVIAMYLPIITLGSVM